MRFVAFIFWRRQSYHGSALKEVNGTGGELLEKVTHLRLKHVTCACMLTCTGVGELF